MQSRSALSLISAVLAASLISAVPAHAGGRVTLDTGHVDVIDIEYENGALEVHVHDETVEPDVTREPGEVLFRALPESRTTVPDGPAYAFLGRPGAPLWVLPEVENPGLLWPGISTEELSSGVFAADSVTLKLRNVRGPGRFSIFTEGAAGTPDVLVNSGDGLPDATALSVGGHKHASWAFSAPGTYWLTFQVTAQLTGGTQRVASEPVTYLFKVG
ncbi:choice-of-anchor M domain-containing protein [Actinomadura sp. 6N118]|uniref:choice-of-anchor M domain-containing protein n=1 Tax=Actinomadura sp. 6N118 TaxID=3375151 RepID=UPI003787F91D